MATRSNPLDAKWVECPGMKEGAYYHDMRDYCHNCAPWWGKVALCPACNKRMPTDGVQKCKSCSEYVRV